MFLLWYANSTLRCGRLKTCQRAVEVSHEFACDRNENNHDAHAACKQWFLTQSVAKSAIDAAYGFLLRRDRHMGVYSKRRERFYIMANTIGGSHMSLTCCIAQAPTELTCCHSGALVLEADARSETPLHSVGHAQAGISDGLDAHPSTHQREFSGCTINGQDCSEENNFAHEPCFVEFHSAETL